MAVQKYSSEKSLEAVRGYSVKKFFWKSSENSQETPIQESNFSKLPGWRPRRANSHIFIQAKFDFGKKLIFFCYSRCENNSKKHSSLAEINTRKNFKDRSLVKINPHEHFLLKVRHMRIPLSIGLDVLNYTLSIEKP